MKILLSSLLFSLFIAAQSAHAQPATLKEIMSQSGDHLKAIAQGINVPARNPETAVHASSVRQLFVFAFQFEPEVLKRAPEAEKPVLLRTYQKLVGKVISITAEIEEALLANDNAKAKTLVADLVKVRQEGHALFNPQ